MIRKLITIIALALLAIGAHAQSLTPAQQTALKTYINGQADLSAAVAIRDWPAVAIALNQPSNPALYVYKSSVSLGEIGRAMLQADIANLTTANTSRLQVIAQFADAGRVVPTADMQSGFASIFSVSGASGTRANLTALWQRQALRIEGVLATCPCTSATPGALNYEGTISGATVQQVMTQ